MEKKQRKLGVKKTAGEFSVLPVQYEILCKDEFSRTVDGPPDEPNHQHLQPGALQQLNLVVQGQPQETWTNASKII